MSIATKEKNKTNNKMIFITDVKININQLMVFRGYAVAYLRYSKKYLQEQEDAKSFKFGLWAGKFDLPEEWRKNNK